MCLHTLQRFFSRRCMAQVGRAKPRLAAHSSILGSTMLPFNATPAYPSLNNTYTLARLIRTLKKIRSRVGFQHHIWYFFFLYDIGYSTHYWPCQHILSFHALGVRIGFASIQTIQLHFSVIIPVIHYPSDRVLTCIGNPPLWKTCIPVKALGT